MAVITQEFEANFTKYLDAVSQADAQLKSFATDSDKIASQLGRLTDQFTGTKVVQQAELMAEAIDRVGGAATLTDAELAKIAPTVNEAVAKLQALGIDVPDKLQAVADKTKDIKTANDGWVSSITDVVQGYVGLEGLRMAVDWVEQTAAQAKSLEILSAQTQINVDDLQELSGVMKESGVDADTLAKGLYNLSRKAAGDDTSVATGLHLMGMSLEDIKGLDGEQLFLTIEHGLSTLQGSLRDTASADLFGSRLGRAMAGASTNIDEVMKHWRELNTVVSTENNKALADFDTALNRTKQNLQNFGANTLAGVVDGFNTLFDATNKGATRWQVFVAMFKDFVASNTVTGASTSHLADLLDHLNQQTAANTKGLQANASAHDDHKTAMTADEQAAAFMASVKKDATKALTATQADYLTQLAAINQATAQNAAALGISAAQFDIWKKNYDAGIEATKQFNKAVEDANSVGADWRGTLADMDGGVVEWAKHLIASGMSAQEVATYYGLTAAQAAALEKSIKADGDALKLQGESIKTVMGLWNDYFTMRASESATTTDKQIADVHKWEQAQILAAQKAKTDTGEFYTALQAVVSEKLNAIQVDWNALNNTMTTETQRGLQQTADKAQAIYQEALKHVGEWSDATIQKYRDAADAAQLAANEFGTGFQTNADKATAAVQKTGQAIGDTAAKAKAAADAANQRFTMQSAVSTGDLQALAAQTGGEVVNDSYGNPYVWIPGKNAAPPTRASGGPVSAGTSYLVGEQGPELFVPSSSGSILPNGAGATVVNNTFHLVDTASNLARQVSDIIGRTVTQSRRV
jgi:hypothetical protein